ALFFARSGVFYLDSCSSGDCVSTDYQPAVVVNYDCVRLNCILLPVAFISQLQRDADLDALATPLFRNHRLRTDTFPIRRCAHVTSSGCQEATNKSVEQL